MIVTSVLPAWLQLNACEINRRSHLNAELSNSMRKASLIDPHGDLAETVVANIPKKRTNDVVYFDAGDRDFPITFNPLETTDCRDDIKTASSVFSCFEKVFKFELSSSPRMTNIFRNSLLTLVGTPGTTLISLQRILTNEQYRNQVVAAVDNPAVRHFWQQEFDTWHERERVQYIASLQNKLGAFLSNPILQGVLGQSRGSVDLRQIMDQGQVMIVNLSKGRVGEDAAGLLGSFLVSQLQVDAMSRADTEEHERRDFFAYVDEFQNFATGSFATILSEARKYRLSLTLAHQYLSQIDDDKIRDAVFGNVGSLIAFQVGAEDGEYLAQQLGNDITPRDLMNIPKYHSYVRPSVHGIPESAFSMATLEPVQIQKSKAANVKRVSREWYAKPVSQVQKEVAKQWGM